MRRGWKKWEEKEVGLEGWEVGSWKEGLKVGKCQVKWECPPKLRKGGNREGAGMMCVFRHAGTQRRHACSPLVGKIHGCNNVALSTSPG